MFSSRKSDDSVCYSGSYKSWSDAKSASKGYNQQNIFDKKIASLERILSNEKKCERDTILYDHYQYSLPTILGINFASNRYDETISVLDYGGGLASSFFRNLKVLEKYNLNWTIVEQEQLVTAGREKLANFNQISFLNIFEFNNFHKQLHFDVVLLGSSIQFFENPSTVIAKLNKTCVKSIVVEQTPFVEHGPSKITVQNIKQPIYESSYPVWHFNEMEFHSWISPTFEEEYRFVNPHIKNNCQGFSSVLVDLVFVRKRN